MHPTLFHVYGEPVHAYTVANVVAYAVGAAWLVRVGVRGGRSLADMLELVVVLVSSAFLGAKLFHTLFEAEGHALRNAGAGDDVAHGVGDLLRDDPWHWARLFDPGYVFYGGVVVATIVGWLWCLRRGLPRIGALADAAVPGLLFGTLVGRVGCFLAGCCFGAPSDRAWAVRFPAGHASGGVPVHPVQLYDAAFGLLGLAVYAWLSPKQRFAGEAMCAYLVSYAVFRFATELWRGDAERGTWLGGVVSTSQVTALVTLPAALVVWRALLLLDGERRARRLSEPA